MKRFLTLFAIVAFATSCLSSDPVEVKKDPIDNLPSYLGAPADSVASLFTDYGYVVIPVVIDGPQEPVFAKSATDWALVRDNAEGTVNEVASIIAVDTSSTEGLQLIFTTYDDLVSSGFFGVKFIEVTITVDGKHTEYEDVESAVEALEDIEIDSISEASILYTAEIEGEDTYIEIPYFSAVNYANGGGVGGYYSGIMFSRME